jgi:hypothetical protein
MTRSRFLKSAAVAAACAAAGTIAGIAGSSAAPSNSNKSDGPEYGFVVKGAETRAAPPGAADFKIERGGPPVHATEVVPNKGGDGFDTVTHDSGTVKSISGDHITITEGTDKATYATPTLTVPADATIQRNFQDAKLSDIKVGDHVDVSSSSDGTTNVFAVDSQHWPPKPIQLSGSAKTGALPPGPPPPAGAPGFGYGYKVR